MRLIQFVDETHIRRVGLVDSDRIEIVEKYHSVYDLAQAAISKGVLISDLVQENTPGKNTDYETLILQDRILSPVDHQDPSHFYVSGTGLTHSGSADTRSKMHNPDGDLTDSMKMFNMGVDGGKPQGNTQGVQPEWFYKGNGYNIVRPNEKIVLPFFGLDGGEEPEIAGIYLVSNQGDPYRIGFVLGNELSDHAMERINYLYLAPSKIRQCSIGPELLVDELPSSIQGKTTIWRNESVLWSKDFFSGEDHMIHSVANLEYHHFKYDIFRNPGDLHCHFFGTATLSYGDGIEISEGDVIEIEAPVFGRSLKNEIRFSAQNPIEIRSL